MSKDKLEEFRKIKDKFMYRDDITVELDEDFNPPHRPAYCSPYDVILILNTPQDEYKHSIGSIRQLLQLHRISYIQITGISEWRSDQQVAYVCVV